MLDYESLGQIFQKKYSMTPKACWLKFFCFATFSSFSEFLDFKSFFVSCCVFRIEKCLHEATYQFVGITYRPKTENWYLKSPPRIEHILEYNMLNRAERSSEDTF